MDLPRLTDVLAEVPRKPNRYSRRARQQRQEHVRSWSLIISGLVIAFLVTLLVLPPVDESPTPPTSLSASVLSLGAGGPRDIARGSTVVGPVAPTRDATEGISSPEESPGPKITPLPTTNIPSSRPLVKKSERVEYLTHEVKRGESLSVIARSYRVDWFTLLSVNKLKSSRSVRPGDILRIPDRKGLLHIVRQDETLEDISLAYDVPLQSIVSANDLEDPDVLRTGQELFLPNAKIPRYLTRAGMRNDQEEPKSARSSRARARNERFLIPSDGSVSSGYGYRIHPISGRWTMHKGIDIASPTGAAIRAVKSGIVTYAGPLGGYGNLVVVEHPDGYTTRYAHCSRIFVSKGEKVRQGERIASVGDTGYTTGPHLHFEIWRNGSALDPATVLLRK